MNDFTASNGFRIEVNRSDPNRIAVVNAGGHLESVLAPDRMHALREFFQAEADERLVRWRWPENPDYVVYPRVDHVAVVNEKSGNALQATRDQAEINTGLCRAARAYFDAHPEPKPWHDAKEDDVWIITYNGVEYPSIFQADRFRGHGGSWGPDDITAARRIYPEVAS